ncbi:MAG: alanine--tRNA ligase, partial [Duncaniella sp.]|nr:alanine--tRNA ligase [Duncaniella sp.]
VGYDETSATTQILRYRKVSLKNKEFYQIVLSSTPFYAEMGGQVGDSGWLINGDETVEIYDTKRENGQAVHLSKTLPADVTVTFEAKINEANRRATECNHTATHLLHAALRQVLGTHVEQKGSYVTPGMLRFDFSHFQKVTLEELRKAERIANANVRKAIPLDEHRCVPIADAMQMGAMALFGEKYGEEVRVIKYGDSVELCGGTHVPNTGNIGMIRIISESSIAAGIRRIEAVTAEVAEDLIDHVADNMREIGEMLHNAPDILQALRKSIDENAELRKQADEFFQERVRNLTRELLEKAETVNGIKIITLSGVRVPDVVKNVAFGVRQLSPEKTAFIAATVDVASKPLLTVAFTDDLVKEGYNASTLVREAAKAIKGGGGGQPGFAQAGGKDKDGISQALQILINTLKK